MKSRMDKYVRSQQNKFQRTKKNTQLYADVYEDIYRDTTYRNMEVIDSAKEINIGKLRNMLGDKYDTRQYRKLRDFSLEDTNNYDIPASEYMENKSYDINEIIKNAKSKRAFIEETREKQKYMEFKELASEDYTSLKEEKELEELINTITLPVKNEDTNDELDLFSDLRGEENTVVTNPVDVTFDNSSKTTETSGVRNTLVNADKTFYTDSNMFTKNDFEDFSTLTRELVKAKGKKKYVIIFLILIILCVCAFFIYTKFILK